MKSVLFTLLAAAVAQSPANANDNGRQTVKCDYRIGGKEKSGTCLIAGSGTNQGITWVVFEVQGKRYRFEESSANVIALIDSTGKVVKKLAGTNSSAQCRVGRPAADVYAFNNGDRVCLYWS